MTSGAIAIVTGATSGIGAALTEALLARGCKVIGVGRNAARLETMAVSLGKAFHPLVLDITDPEATAALPDSLPLAWRDIAVLVNNAGHVGRERFDHFALAHDAAYVASKFAINGLTQALRVDYEGMGMRIIEVAPGVSRTGFAQVRYNGEATRAEEFYERFPAVLEADDVARTIVFALEQPPHVTLGEILMFPSHGRK